MFENFVLQVSKLVDMIQKLVHDYSEASEIVKEIY